MGLGGYIARRIAYNLIILFMIAVINFILFRLIPTDPVAIVVAGRYVKPAQIAALTKLYGLDKSLYQQFFDYIYAMFTFQFGVSFSNGDAVINGILPRIPGTLELLIPSTIISIIIGILIGVVSASRRGGIFDGFVQALSLFTYALPVFWLGFVFLLVFFVGLHWFPSGGISSQNPPPIGLLDTIIDRLSHLTLPTLCLVLISVGGWALLARNSLLEVLTDDYIVTAKAKGLANRAVLYHHAFRNALLPVVTQIAITFGFILSGAVLTETVFSWYGLGRYVFLSLQSLDYPVLQAIFFLIAVTVVFANFIADIAYAFLDPRIRY